MDLPDPGKLLTRQTAVYPPFNFGKLKLSRPQAASAIGETAVYPAVTPVITIGPTVHGEQLGNKWLTDNGRISTFNFS